MSLPALFRTAANPSRGRTPLEWKLTDLNGISTGFLRQRFPAVRSRVAKQDGGVFARRAIRARPQLDENGKCENTLRRTDDPLLYEGVADNIV